MGERIDALKAKVIQYQKAIEKEKEKEKAINRKKMNQRDETPMNDLKEEIKNIFHSVGLSFSSDSGMEHLHMLSLIETEIEKLIARIEDLDNPQWVTKTMKVLEKARRQKQRQKNKRLMEKKEVTEQADDIYYTTEITRPFPTRPLMYRSVPVDEKKVVKKKKKKEKTKKDGFYELFGY